MSKIGGYHTVYADCRILQLNTSVEPIRVYAYVYFDDFTLDTFGPGTSNKMEVAEKVSSHETARIEILINFFSAFNNNPGNQSMVFP